MPFISDNKAFRTYDPERGFELFRVGGGSDGTDEFKITGPGGSQFRFWANSYREQLTDEEALALQLPPEVDPIVWRIHNWNMEWRDIIKEAMEAFVGNHGSPIKNMRAFIRFGSNGSVTDA